MEKENNKCSYDRIRKPIAIITIILSILLIIYVVVSVTLPKIGLMSITRIAMKGGNPFGGGGCGCSGSQ